MRYGDIQELIDSIKDDIKLIDNKYDEAVKDENIKAVLKPKVKSCLENLRSCLEYCAHDIYEKYYTKQMKIYFPYGENRQNFRTAIGKYFKDLNNLKPEVYNLLKSIQPYKCNDSWLIDLCSLTNINKHVKLSEQYRIDKRAINIENTMYFEDCDNIIISKNVINGKPQEGDIIIKNDKLQYDEEKINWNIEQINWIEFKFKDTNIGVKEILEKSLKEIEKFVDKLYKIIN